MNDSKKVIGTHDGHFHADEVLACVMLKQLSEYRNAKIIRTRNNDLLKDCDIVVDVGGAYDVASNRYDHHQREFNRTFHDYFPTSLWKIKLSSAGLVYVHFGHRILSSILKKPNDEFIKVLFDKFDAIDNGVSISHGITRIGSMNPLWNQPVKDETKNFHEALQFLEDEFLRVVHNYANSWFPARDIVLDAIKARYDIHPSGKIIQIKGPGCPWKDHLLEFEKGVTETPNNELDFPSFTPGSILFCIYERENSTWTIQAIPLIGGDSFTKSWRGLRDESLSAVVGIPDCVFVHATGFLGIHKNYEGIMHMANLAFTLKN